ncbi:aromatic-ring hydroxylase C-terminal domain-containing protein, partial [Streptomyces sp. NPDC003487]
GGPGGRRPGGILDVALGYRYPAGAIDGADPSGPVVPDRLELSGAPGSRAPHLWVRRADGSRVSTLDLYETSLVLLCDAQAGHAWYDAALRLADELRLPLRPHRVGPGGDLVPEEDTPTWSARHGVAPGGAVLVRPDGFTAWRTAHAVQDAERELRRVLGKILSIRT